MLLPGAGLVINTVIVIVFFTISGLIGLVSAAIFFKAGPFLTHKTFTYKDMVKGRKPIPANQYNKWWLHDSNFFKVGWWVGFVICVYCGIGPVKALTRYIGGL